MNFFSTANSEWKFNESHDITFYKHNRRTNFSCIDYTLWPFWVDTHVTPPFRNGANGKIVDSSGAKIECYTEVPEILKMLYDQGYSLGAASRTGEIRGANQLIELFGWSKYFKYKEIFPGSKITHFNNFRKNSGIQFTEMLFFDDENRNIEDIRKLGVVSILVKNGISRKVIEEGMSTYVSENSSKSKK